MKHFLAALVALLLSCGLAIGQEKPQEQQPPDTTYPFEYEGKSGIAKFAGKSYDEVWGAVIRSLVASNYKVTLSEKDAGLIEAVHIRSESSKTWGALLGSGKAEEARMTLLVEPKDTDIVVTIRYDRAEKLVLRKAATQRKRICGMIFQKVADSLYPAEKEK